MIAILVALLIIGIVYIVAKAILPEPIPLVTALILFLIFVLVPLLHHAH